MILLTIANHRRKDSREVTSREGKRNHVLDLVLNPDEEEVEKEGPDQSSQPRPKAKARAKLRRLPKKEKAIKAKV